MSTPDLTQLERAVPATVLRLCRRLRDKGFRAWLVGGCVRDELLRRSDQNSAAEHDWDLATDARPEQVRSCFRRVIPTGIQHGTVTVLLDGESYELTTLRGETTYTDGRHPDSVYFVRDLDADLARRDFTVNALAYEPLEGTLIDPHGGHADLEARLLRAVGDPRARFGEDGLRVLRAARFAATLEFEVEARTLAAIEPSLQSYRRVSPERIRDEWLKCLVARQPSRGYRIMLHHGMLAVTAPELAACVGRPSGAPGDVWEHTMRCLDTCGRDPLLRLAALLHDIGKAHGEGSATDADGGFSGHDVVGSELAARLLQRLRFSNRERDQVVEMVAHHVVGYDPSWDDAALRRWVFRVGPALVQPLCELGRADVEVGDFEAARSLGDVDSLRTRAGELTANGFPCTVRDLAVNGHDLMEHLGMKPGSELGRLLRALLDEVVADPDRNTRQRLLARAAELRNG